MKIIAMSINHTSSSKASLYASLSLEKDESLVSHSFKHSLSLKLLESLLVVPGIASNSDLCLGFHDSSSLISDITSAYGIVSIVLPLLAETDRRNLFCAMS